MSPESGLVIIVALLWGPTMLWLLLRLARGGTTRSTFSERDTSGASGASASKSVAADVGTLVDDFGFWLCAACKSLNRSEAKRCYACRAKRDHAAEPEVETAPKTAAPVPVMASTSTWTAVGPGHPASAGAGAAAPKDAAGLAVVAAALTPDAQPATTASIAGGEAARPAGTADQRSVSEAPPTRTADGHALPATGTNGTAGVSVLPATQDLSDGADLPVQAGATAALGPMTTSSEVAGGLAPSPRAGLTVCPFLGLDGDPSTWFDFPDPNNVCHAVPRDDGTPLESFLRRVGVRPSARLLEAGTQRSKCLSEAHRACARYLAAMSVLAGPEPRQTHPPAKPEVQPASQSESLATVMTPGGQDPVPSIADEPLVALSDPKGEAGAPDPSSPAVETEPPTEPHEEATPAAESSPAESSGSTSDPVAEPAAETPTSATPDETPAKRRRAADSNGRSKATGEQPQDPVEEAAPAETAPKRRKRTRTTAGGATKRATDGGSTAKGRRSAPSTSRGSRSSRS